MPVSTPKRSTLIMRETTMLFQIPKESIKILTCSEKGTQMGVLHYIGVNGLIYAYPSKNSPFVASPLTRKKKCSLAFKTRVIIA